MDVAILYAPSMWAEWKTSGGVGKPPFPPIAILPTWSDAAIVEDIMPGTYVVVERLHDRVNKPTHRGCIDFLTPLLGAGEPVREGNAGRWSWRRHQG